MSETTGGLNCPECGMSFDTSNELGRHSQRQHATAKAKGEPEEKVKMPAIEEGVQSRLTEEKGKGETAESTQQ